MAIERKRVKVESSTPQDTRVTMSFTAGSGNGTLTLAGGSKALLSSISGTNGSYTLVLKQAGSSFVGAFISCVSASTIISCRPLSWTSATKTLTFKTDNAAGTATAPANTEIVSVELLFRDTVGL